MPLPLLLLLVATVQLLVLVPASERLATTARSTLIHRRNLLAAASHDASRLRKHRVAEAQTPFPQRVPKSDVVLRHTASLSLVVVRRLQGVKRLRLELFLTAACSATATATATIA